MERICSQSGCKHPSTHTLTYDYVDKLAVIGPLSPEPESSAHDLCRSHAQGFTVPQGWNEMRHLDLANEQKNS